MYREADVIIVGAGPVGLQLACELGLAGVSVIVLERDVDPNSAWKTELGLRGLNTPSVESFYRRGLFKEIFDDKHPDLFEYTSGFQFGGHFAGIHLNANQLDLKKFRYRLNGPSLVPGRTTIKHLESVLSTHAERSGVTILRGQTVKDVEQNEDGITLNANDVHFKSKWLVGCDGGRSMIRKLFDFEMIGTEPAFVGYIFTADLDKPEALKVGMHITKTGMYIYLKPKAIYLIDFDVNFDRSQKITKEHLQNIMDRVTGIDVKILQIHLTSTFTDRSKQVTEYRKGRIILAGDAAHIHSPLGAQGLNLGLGDAFNLGWKLAAIIHGADIRLLDTYQKERHPLGAWVLEWTRAQVTALKPDLYGISIQNLFKDLIATHDGTNLFLDRMWGLSQRYDLGIDHDIVGRSVPDFEFLDGTRLGLKLINGKGLFLDFAGSCKDMDLKNRIEYVDMKVKDNLGLGAVILRPDGVVVWAIDEKEIPKSKEIEHVLERWFQVDLIG